MELSTGEITEPKELSTVKPAPKKKGKEKKG